MKKSESIRINTNTYEAIKRIAEKDRRTITETLNIIVEEYEKD